MEETRYSWKQMPEDYKASYYNKEDYKKGRKFVIIDNKTGEEYIFPQIETKRNSDGRIYDRITIDSDLWTEEFMAWAVSTSMDFINHLGEDWLTTSFLNYVVEHFEFVEIFSYWDIKLRAAMTRELWNMAFQRNKNVVRYVPREYMTSEMINTLVDLKNLSLGNFKYEDLTPELFKKIYFNCDEKHKLSLLKPAPTCRTKIPYDDTTGVKDLITKEVADDILAINIRTIWNIPHSLITKEDANKAMNTDPLLMQYIPAEYQTPEYQKKVIDTNTSNLALINPSVLTDEMIFYALSKSGKVLGSVPKEKRTFEVCEYAISNYAGALRNVPDNVKNADLCFKAVVKDPRVIKYVPVEFLNQEFVNKLNSVGVIIPVGNNEYVNACLMAHKKLEEEQLNVNEVVSNTTELIVDSDYGNIRLESLSGLLTNNSLNFLSQYNIVTVGDILKVSDNSALYNIILNDTKEVYKQIRGAIRLLKCKFMNIDPLIEFIDTEDIKTFCNEIGFSTRTTNVLIRNGITPMDLYEIMHNPTEQASLYRIKNSGDSTVQEIIFKTTILTDFYDKKEKTTTEDETIEALERELDQVRAEIQRLNTRTDEILAKIQQKKQEKAKGGVLK